MKLPTRTLLAVAFLLSPIVDQSLQAACPTPVKYMGVNIAGGGFGSVAPPPGVSGWYMYPNHLEMDFFAAKGMNIIRVPFRWERVQRILNGPLETAELARIDEVVTYAVSKGLHVLLDPHNFGAYYGVRIGQTPVSPAIAPTAENLADFWSKLAPRYIDNPNVIFGLMNEPSSISMQVWLDAANKSIAAIRTTGATNQIFVPGNYWDSAASWLKDQGGGQSNGTVMLGIVDPLDNYTFEVHQYFNKGYNGSTGDCVSDTEGTKILTAITGWARTNHKQLFLGEFAVGANPTCLATLTNLMDFMNTNSDVWYGWTWWAAGPWNATYPFTLGPPPPIPPPHAQQVVLDKYLTPPPAK